VMWNDTIFPYLYLLEVDFGKETSLSLFVIWMECKSTILYNLVRGWELSLFSLVWGCFIFVLVYVEYLMYFISISFNIYHSFGRLKKCMLRDWPCPSDQSHGPKHIGIIAVYYLPCNMDEFWFITCNLFLFILCNVKILSFTHTWNMLT
jgi:hypothetical protein